VSGRHVRTLADVGVTARGVLDLAALHLAQIVLEPGDRRLLDELVRVLLDRLDASLGQLAARTAADLGDKYRMAVVDGADNGRQRILLAVAALAVEIDAPVADELGAGGAELVDLEFLGVAEVLVDPAGALGRDRDQQPDVAILAGQR